MRQERADNRSVGPGVVGNLRPKFDRDRPAGPEDRKSPVPVLNLDRTKAVRENQPVLDRGADVLCSALWVNQTLVTRDRVLELERRLHHLVQHALAERLKKHRGLIDSQPALLRLRLRCPVQNAFRVPDTRI